jgi:hypothetical protein
MTWREWFSTVNNLVLTEIGHDVSILNPPPPLFRWYLLKVNPRVAARWALSKDNG